MNTIILFWNPAISSYSLHDFQRELKDVFDCYNDMNWSVWEHEKAHAGDRFFMVRCGEGKTGICMSGYFSSKPYKGEDWSGRGRETFYMDLEPDVMIHPEYLPILTTEKLMAEIPSFDWTGGHSGRLLDKKDAEKLENLWSEFVDNNEDIFLPRAVRQEVDPSDYVTENDQDHLVVCNLSYTAGGKVKVYNQSYKINKSFSTVNAAKQFALDALKDEVDNEGEVKFQFEHIYETDHEKFAVIFDKLLSLKLSKKEREVIRFQYEENYFLAVVLFYLVKYGKETLATLHRQGFPKDVVDAVKALLPVDGETEVQHLRRMKKNEMALDIKSELLENEMNIFQLDEITMDDVERLNHVLKALHELQS